MRWWRTNMQMCCRFLGIECFASTPLNVFTCPFQTKIKKRCSVTSCDIPSRVPAFVSSNVDIVQTRGRIQCSVRGIRRNRCNRCLATPTGPHFVAGISDQKRKITSFRDIVEIGISIGDILGYWLGILIFRCFWTFWNKCWNCWNEIEMKWYYSSTIKLATKSISFHVICQPSFGDQKKHVIRNGLHMPAHAKHNLKMEPSGCEENQNKNCNICNCKHAMFFLRVITKR